MLDILRDAATRIRANARASSSSPDVADGVRTLVSTVGYVRASTSRVGRRRFGWEAESREVSRFVARGGEVVAETTDDEGDGADDAAGAMRTLFAKISTMVTVVETIGSVDAVAAAVGTVAAATTSRATTRTISNSPPTNCPPLSARCFETWR